MAFHVEIQRFAAAENGLWRAFLNHADALFHRRHQVALVLHLQWAIGEARLVLHQFVQPLEDARAVLHAEKNENNEI